eukprot:CAMPEP_0181295024 /NCGR_PEP_ID=MMETSP1101-20121128/3918_1 /TAXON_ID=46948 /ORGANISM="Rhodomonas abbreviata, Strain Caron Lab Isolate" /LENGTH=274 /DNA_ID=CAMNT_0023399731 /DNA_START=109 /DNA_END=933 /DNA_ORIENTATION=-
MHIKLSEQQVLEIYSYRPLPSECEQSPLAGRSSELSRIYGISTKAIRDIWNLRSWAHVTQKDAEGQVVEKPEGVAIDGEKKALLAVRQPPGRPTLLKDSGKTKSRKRNRSAASKEEDDESSPDAGAALFNELLANAKRPRGENEAQHSVIDDDFSQMDSLHALQAIAALQKPVPENEVQNAAVVGHSAQDLPPDLAAMHHAQQVKEVELNALAASVQQAQLNLLAMAASLPAPTPFGTFALPHPLGMPGCGLAAPASFCPVEIPPIHPIAVDSV